MRCSAKPSSSPRPTKCLITILPRSSYVCWLLKPFPGRGAWHSGTDFTVTRPSAPQGRHLEPKLASEAECLVVSAFHVGGSWWSWGWDGVFSPPPSLCLSDRRPWASLCPAEDVGMVTASKTPSTYPHMAVTSPCRSGDPPPSRPLHQHLKLLALPLDTLSLSTFPASRA